MNIVRHTATPVSESESENNNDLPKSGASLSNHRPLLWQTVAFTLIVIAPIFTSLIYINFLAVILYQSETSFSVRSRSGSAPVGGLGQLTQQFGVGLQGGNELHAIHAYLESGEALEHLNRMVNYRTHIIERRGDPLLDMDLHSSDTKILNRFNWMFKVRTSTFEQIITIQARAYSPKMAQATAVAGIKVAEAFLNRMNTRANQDVLSYSSAELTAAKNRVRETRSAITQWRNSNGSVNPTMQIQTVQSNLNALEQELSRVDASISRYSTPRVKALRDSRNSLKRQITKERARLAGSSVALAPLIAEYEELEIERELADHQYDAATQAFLAAKQEASQQQKYLIMVSQPTPGDEPNFPRPYFHVASITLGCLALYIIVIFGANVIADYRRT